MNNDYEIPEEDDNSFYCKIKHGKTLYCITSVYTGEIDLKETLEDLIVKRVLKR